MATNYFNCVYLLINMKNGKRYVGKTTNFRRRCNEHKSRGKKRYKDQSLYIDINEMGFDFFKKIVLLDNLTQEEMNYYEKFYIQYYDTLENGGTGYNIGNGGEHENKFAGMTKNNKQQLSNTLSNASTSRKKVAKYNSHGRLIETYNSYKDAQEDIGRRVQSLSETKPKKVGMYYLLMYDDIPQQTITIIKPKNSPQRIFKYDEDMNLVKEYSSYTKAQEDGYSKYFIQRVLNMNETYKNYYWKIEE